MQFPLGAAALSVHSKLSMGRWPCHSPGKATQSPKDVIRKVPWPSARWSFFFVSYPYNLVCFPDRV